MPTLTPVDYDPFYEATGADKPVFEPQAKLIAKTLFDVAPTLMKPAIGMAGGFVEGLKEGFNKAGQAGLKSYAEALENTYVPEGAVKYDDAGDYYDKDGNKLNKQYRPNILPFTRGEGGTPEFAMPAMADVWNTLGGPGGIKQGVVGAGASLRPALKYMDKIYKAKPGEQHLDAIPKELQDIFQKQALSGEDISNFNFGFINHKGHFLQREEALKYAIDNGILDPNDAKYGTLVTTMLNQSGGEGKIASTFFSALEDAVSKINQNKASGDQWIGTLSNAKGVKGEELEWTGLKEFLAGKKDVTKGEIEDFIKSNRVEINDVWKGGDLKKKYTFEPDEDGFFNILDEQGKVIDSGYQNARAAEREILRLNGIEQSIRADAELNKGTKYHNYQLPGGDNYRELLMTLPAEKPKNLLVEAQRIAKESGEDWFSLGPQTQKNYLKDAEALQPNKPYISSHWDEPNILAHMRMNDRTIDGKKSLHLEEIQSDWHQQGRDKGYKSSKSKAEFDRLNKEFEDARADLGFATEKKANELLGMSYQKYRAMHPNEKDEALKKLKEYRAKDPEYVALEKKVEELEKAKNAINPVGGVPDAPFKKTWHELALKRAIREAAEKGYERLSWTPGEAQAARYDLSKQVDKVKLVPVETAMNGQKINFKLEAYKDNHPVIEQWLKDESELSSYVGKEVAEKLLKNYKDNKTNVWGVKNKKSGNWSQRFASKAEAEKYQSELPESVRGNTDVLEMTPKHAGELSGEQLTIGGEGMKGFYDQIIPKSVEKIAKEFGVKVKKAEINDVSNKSWAKKDGSKLSQTVFYIDIPPAMRKSVMQKGQPLFSGTSLVPVNYNPFEDEK